MEAQVAVKKKVEVGEGGIDIVVKKQTGPLDNPLGNALRKWQKDVVEHDCTALEARWKFGKALVRQREGKQKLPPGLRDAVVQEFGITKAEITYRMQFAEVCPDSETLFTAVNNHPTWRQVRREVLPKRKRGTGEKKGTASAEPTPRVVTTKIKACRVTLGEAMSAHVQLTENALHELERLKEVIEFILGGQRNKGGRK